MYRPNLLLALIVTTGLFTAACDSDDPITPTEPEPIPVEALFGGTLTPNGGVTHTFNVQRQGQVTAQLTSLTPDGAVIGLSIGPQSSLACSATVAQDNAKSGTTLVGTASVGNFCVRVFDAAGSLTGPVEYQITVRHF